jgi:hypothetical protein
MENTSKSRSIPCIALYPCCNAMGSWEFMSLKSKTRVYQSQWQLMVTTQAVIDALEAFDEELVAFAAEPAINIGAPVPGTPVVESLPRSPSTCAVDTDTAVAEPVGAEESPRLEPVPEVSAKEQEQEGQPEVVEEEEDPHMPDH